MSLNLRNKCDHNDNRKKVCAVCGMKIVFGKQKAEYFRITESLLILIKQFYTYFDVSDPKFPTGLCTTCRLTLREHDAGEKRRPLPSMPNFKDIRLLPQTRQMNNQNISCSCYICLMARRNVHVKLVTGRGKARKKSVMIKKENGLFSAPECRSSSDFVKVEVRQANKVLKVCETCLGKIGKGISHNCTVRGSTQMKNAAAMLNRVPEDRQEQVAASIVRRKITKQNVDPNGHGELKLKTQGSKMRIGVNPSNKKSVFFSADILDDYKNNSGTSQNNMKKLVNLLRCGGGKQCVPAYYSKHMSKKAKLLQNSYKSEIFQFDVEGSQTKENRPVVWGNAEELLEAVIEEREIIGNVEVKMMADGGQGFFKICMSIWPENYIPKYSDTDEDLEDNFCEKVKTRSLYSEGGSSSKRAKLTSVKRLIILCIVPKIKESYENIKLLFDLININAIPFKFVSDLKLLLIINGQQTATSSYPCPYCHISLTDLRNQKDSSSHDQRSKTFKDLREDFEKFCTFDRKKTKAKECHSTVNPPLFNEDENLCVIQKCVVPELHIIQGFVNHLFWDGLVNLVGEDNALKWPTKLNVFPKNYHRRIFEGNACRKMLRESDKLLNSSIYGEVGIFGIMPFVTCFKEMNALVENCFSLRVLDQAGVKKQIVKLRKAVAAVNISETLKFHILMWHIEECLDNLDENEGLGLWSEQAGESIHREFLIIWTNYKMTCFEDPRYSERLKAAVIEFSSIHV